jgi:tRNA(His) 5'-end guanylyltransferase
VATFETRLYEFPESDMALEYFAWRKEEAELTAIDRYCVHVLSQNGADSGAVPRILDGLGPDEKVELMRQNSLDFGQVPSWQRNGATVRLKPEEGDGMARLLIDLNLPSRGEFADYLRRALSM